MKKLALLFFMLIISQSFVLSRPSVFNEDGKFGLKDEQGQVIAEAKYKKMIRLGESAWIIQYRNKFGIMNDCGEIIVEPKYSRADRLLGKFVKFTKGDKNGIFDEKGFDVLPVEYSSIDLLYGGMFLTCKNYKYGVTDHNGQVILDNIFDDIYMPKPHLMVIVYNGNKYEIENIKGNVLTLPFDKQMLTDESTFKITEIISKPATATGYYSVTATNYFLKIFSSISPAYEETIDELMFLQGADAANTIIKFSWIPKFPFVYAKKYYKTLIAPNNGPLKDVKNSLKYQLQD